MVYRFLHLEIAVFIFQTKTFVAGWRKVLRKVERWSTLRDKFSLCCSLFIELTTCHATNAAILDPHYVNQPIRALHFFNPQQMFLLQDKLITQGEKRETSIQNLQRNNVALQIGSFCISYFAAYSISISYVKRRPLSFCCFCCLFLGCLFPSIIIFVFVLLKFQFEKNRFSLIYFLSISHLR